jgi:hypothetical protein
MNMSSGGIAYLNATEQVTSQSVAVTLNRKFCKSGGRQLHHNRVLWRKADLRGSLRFRIVRRHYVS